MKYKGTRRKHTEDKKIQEKSKEIKDTERNKENSTKKKTKKLRNIKEKL